MSQIFLLDTGPLVALLNRRDDFYNWATAEWAKIEPPLLTCEAVLVEACFLVRNLHPGQEAVISLVNSGVIEIALRLDEEASSISQLLVRYQSVPMSLADACLVRMTELYADSILLTLDSDFRIYRKKRAEIIPVIMPQDR